MTRSLPVLLLFLTSVMVAGCASRRSENTIPRDGPTISQIYRDHQYSAPSDQNRLPQPARAVAPADVDLHGYTRSADNEVDQLFPVVPNPTLVMYVYPHVRGSMPVPGYSTAFPMYDRVHFALPGEVRQAPRSAP